MYIRTWLILPRKSSLGTTIYPVGMTAVNRYSQRLPGPQPYILLYTHILTHVVQHIWRSQSHYQNCCSNSRRHDNGNLWLSWVLYSINIGTTTSICMDVSVRTSPEQPGWSSISLLWALWCFDGWQAHQHSVSHPSFISVGCYWDLASWELTDDPRLSLRNLTSGLTPQQESFKFLGDRETTPNHIIIAIEIERRTHRPGELRNTLESTGRILIIWDLINGLVLVLSINQRPPPRYPPPMVDKIHVLINTLGWRHRCPTCYHTYQQSRTRIVPTSSQTRTTLTDCCVGWYLHLILESICHELSARLGWTWTSHQTFELDYQTWT